MRIQWLDDAIGDLETQIDYIAGDNPDAADRMEELVATQVRLLEKKPRIGRKGRRPGTRELVIGHRHSLLFIASRRGTSKLCESSMERSAIHNQ